MTSDVLFFNVESVPYFTYCVCRFFFLDYLLYTVIAYKEMVVRPEVKLIWKVFVLQFGFEAIHLSSMYLS